ncbi:hypothetical protein Pcac1_g19593 [Phytophthora cactorum]|nr:hypothetical protein Pcac1_g19593 [Phytophthora cactorum]
MSEETPTSTRIWAQTECWRISSSPPASVCMVVALWTVGDVKPRMLHALVVEVHASGECQRALQHLEKDVINEATDTLERQATPLMPEPTPGVPIRVFCRLIYSVTTIRAH